MNRTLLVSFIFSLASLFSLCSFAQTDRYLAGTHFKIIEPAVRTADATKIEVLEIFWYGCPGCYTFEPILNDWLAKPADDIAFVRFPGVFNPLMKVHAQIFYMSQSLGILDLSHDRVFDTLVRGRKPLNSERQIIDQFVEFGFARDDIEKAFNSFAVRTKTNQAEKLTRDYKPSGTPSMVVNGKYLISIGGPVSTYQEMLNVVDFLTEKERQ